MPLAETGRQNLSKEDEWLMKCRPEFQEINL